jgi:hypothetical protein
MSHGQVDGFFNNVLLAPIHLGFLVFNPLFTITFYIVRIFE